ncbi:MAG: hypothetical protein IT374_05950 [Polyangiaceae bacterium]|nr:hypothetical protein [Polyangiaceae bacterium]
MRALLAVGLLLGSSLVPAASTCDTKCDRDAAACVDGCEASHAKDPARRVGCKLKCSERREACAGACR